MKTPRPNKKSARSRVYSCFQNHPAADLSLRGSAGETVMEVRSRRGESSIAGAIPGPGDDRRVLDEVFSAAYEELRRLAGQVRRGDPGATLSPTALVNEAWLKLAGAPAVANTSRLHFKRIAARAMRQVLVEAARRRHAHKRGGPDAVFVTFDDAVARGAAWADDLLGLDAALDGLARLHPRQAVMVESRFFGGLDVPETAALLGISEATVLRDWRAARAWLAHELRGKR
jgi:RNA polymerase sigma factor (TIGR02999 family)